MLTDKAQKIFKMKYAKNGEEWEQLCWRVANYVASKESEDNRYNIAKVFYQMIYNLVFLPGGRILANSATGINNLNNCFVLPIEDSRESIYQALKDAAEIFAWGGGLGFYFGNLREEGADVKTTGGSASGPMSFMTLFDQTGEVISQASRRGAQLASMPIDHPDIEKFINYKSTLNNKNKRLLGEYLRNLEINGLDKKGSKYFKVLEKTLQDDQLSHFNISVLLSDKFMDSISKEISWNLISRFNGEAVKTVDAKSLLQQIARMAWESGDPGVLFYDRTNEDNMVGYLGELKTTNPCITGDTKILTPYEGPVEIKKLAERNADVLVYTWNPKTKLPEISLMRNIHKTREKARLVEVEFDSGLKVRCTPDHNFYSFRGNKVKAIDLIEGQSVRAFAGGVHPGDGHLRVYGWNNGKAKHKYVARLIWNFFFGDVPEGMIIHHKDYQKLNNAIDNLQLVTNSEHNSLHYSDRARNGFRGRNHKVISVKDCEELEDVYNGTVDNTHTYIIADDDATELEFSGIVSANCGEVPLLPYEPCCLGSLNLHSFYDEKTNSIDFEFLEHVVRMSVVFLDNVQELSYTPVDKVNEWSKGLRRLGLGVMGFADLLAELEIPYDSQNAKDLAEYLSWFISFFAWLESIELAEKRGAFPFYDKDKVNLYVIDKVLNSKFNPNKFNMEEIRKLGVRNVSVTSIAPTGSIALLANVNSGIEPFFALAYKRNITEGIGNTAKDFVIEINPILFKKLEKYGLEESEIEKVKEFILKNGKLGGSEKIPEKLYAVFKTSHEINWVDHVDIQASWQRYVTNAVSKTINCSKETTPEEIYNIYFYMWNSGLKGGTIYRDQSKSFQILNIGS